VGKGSRDPTTQIILDDRPTDHELRNAGTGREFMGTGIVSYSTRVCGADWRESSASSYGMSQESECERKDGMRSG
jgi:hypothetical protein